MSVPLSQLRPSNRGTILEVEGEDSLTGRLLEMGLVEGERVEFVGTAPLGDPIEVRVGHYSLSLRKEEAKRVRVRIDP